MTTGIFLSFLPSFVRRFRVCMRGDFLPPPPVPTHSVSHRRRGGGENVKGPGKIKEEEAATILTPL